MKKFFLTLFALWCVSAPVGAAVSVTGIFGAVEHGDRQEARRLLAKNPRDVLETNKKGQTPLLLAVEKKDLDMAYLLIKSSARLTARADKGNPLHIAVMNQDEPMIKMLLKEAAAKDPALPARLANYQRNLYNPSSLTSDDGNSPLHLAAQRCNERIYNYLLANGADENLSNGMNKTPAELLKSCKQAQEIMARQKKIRQAKERAAAAARKDDGI